MFTRIFNSLILLFLPFYIGCGAGAAGESTYSTGLETPFRHIDVQHFRQQARLAKPFCAREGMNTRICLLADMNIHSGKARLVVWDFSKDTFVVAGLVSHGCGAGPWGKDRSRERPVFSNRPDSHCSSLGKYKVGKRGYGEWGIHVNYLLHGLEPTNSNALARQVVLHGWDAIPDQEVYPDGTPEGWGCPAVSNAYMTTLDSLLRGSKRPVLLWLYR
ncbi:murein L,D-transpeptidase catalytic domain-containing protein [Taibaiella koreensis]|uniref:murein L,D-transpeptidase catalytic domain-containing protein n=1 Tax=Taibaiella koreensis TaxID=1268548 RepID=UPI0019690B70|nr:murein L,D-transpeptidase catalytic domain family protein [Taibaiella koreensis]